MTVAVTARTAGKVTLHVIGDRLVSTVTQDVTAGTARLRVPVGNDWGSGAYVVATLRRPLDARAERMPGRAIGVQWFSINRKARTLALEMPLPDLLRPNSALRIPVKVGGLAPGEDARIVVAAVDVGILNLTNYKPPAPDDYYLGQRRLTADIRDLYGQLIDGMQGARGQIRTGGDAGGGELQGSPPTQKPLALYSGIVAVKPDGTAEVLFDIPDFAGTARVMAVAWSKDKVGRAVGDRHHPRSGGAHRDAAALPAQRRSRHHASRSRQCGGPTRRLPARDEERGRQRCRQRRAADAQAQRQAAQLGHGAAVGRRRRQCSGNSAGQRAGRICARTQLCARSAAGHADPCAAHGQAARERRKPYPLERSVRRSRAGERKRRRCRSASRPRSTRRHCWRRSIVIRSGVPSRSPAARCRCCMSTILRPRRSLHSIRPSISASAIRSIGCLRVRARTARSGCGPRAAMTCGSTPMSPTS